MAFGPELVTNGNFNGNANGWFLSGQSSYNSNNIKVTNGGTIFLRQNGLAYTTGNTYQVSFDIDVPVGGAGLLTTRLYPEYGTNINIGSYAGAGVTNVQVNIVTSSGPEDIELSSSGSLSGLASGMIIDNVSVRQFLPNEYIQITQMVGAETGEVQTINAGKDDDGTPLYYELETQGIEFGNVFHRKKISDKIVVFTKDGMDSALQGKTDNNDYKNIEISLSKRVNIGQSINLEGNTTRFKWFGEANESSPILEGMYIEKVEDMGITKG